MSPIIVANSFALGMCPGGAKVEYRPISPSEARELVSGRPLISLVGHEGTAKILSALLGTEIPVNRAVARFTEPVTMVVASLLTRLPEGAVLGENEVAELLRKGELRLYKVEVQPLG